MFRDLYSILCIPISVIGLSLGLLTSGNVLGVDSNTEVLLSDCNTTIHLDCDSGTMNVTYSLSSNVNTPQSSCVSNSGSDFFRDIWFGFDANGENGYYLDAINSNIGINIFSGTCGDLQLYECIETYDMIGAYWVNYLLPEGAYLIQVMSLVEGENLETEITFGCFEDVNSDCSVAIDFVEVSDCINAIGYADVTVGGNTNKDYVSLELLIDGDLHFFDCEVINGAWISNFQIQGETIDYVSAYAGNSETGCSDGVYEAIDIPIVNCSGNDVDLLKFYGDNTPFCRPISAEVKMYQSGTSTLKHVFNPDFDGDTQSYIIPDPPVGMFDVFIKPLGSLQQGFYTIEIAGGTQTVLLEGIRKGDLNNSNSINILDVSLLSGAFSSIEGDVNYNPQADFNCSGSINIVDISIFVVNFNQVGDGPSIEP